MFEKFTEQAIKAIMCAQEESRRLGHDYVGTEQILLGLLRAESGNPSQILAESGLTLKDARTQVEQLIGRGPGDNSYEIPFTANAKKLLEGGWTAARELRLNFISSELLLISLIRLQEGKGFQILQSSGMDLAALETRLTTALQEAHKYRGTSAQKAYDSMVAYQVTFDRYTERAIKVIMRGQEEARRLGHNILGPEFILVALISETTSVASQSLRELGLNLKEARKIVEEIVGHGTGFVAAEIPLAPRTKDVLQKAAEESFNAGVHYISTEHILLGLLNQTNGAVTKVFDKFGVNRKQLEEKIRSTVLQTSSEQAISRQPEPTLTEDVLAVLVFANEEARKLQHKRTGVEHVLCGLLLQKGTASQALIEYGVDYDKTLAVVQRMHREEPAEPKKRPMFSKLLDTILVIFRQRPFTSQAALLMDKAMKETQARGDLFVDTGHVLLALIDSSTEPSNALALLGIDKQLLKDKIVEIMQKDSEEEDQGG